MLDSRSASNHENLILRHSIMKNLRIKSKTLAVLLKN